MEELKALYAKAGKFKAERASLAAALRSEEEQYRQRLREAEESHAAEVRRLEAERQAVFDRCDARAQEESTGYARMKGTLQSFLTPIMRWCPEAEARAYQPDPALISEAEVQRLIRMVQEQGILAWLKRTFRLGGYASRGEMALSLYQKVEDASAYCNQRIQQAADLCTREKQEQATRTRRELQAAGERYAARRKELEERWQNKRKMTLEAIQSFEDSAGLRALHREAERVCQEAEQACGSWGEYTAPADMPQRVQLCDVELELPDRNGLNRKLHLPLWLDLFRCNIVVFTGAGNAGAGTDCLEKRLVRQLLARLLKTVPPENCSCSIFDSLHKGASLERLIDVTNIGTTDISFDLFTGSDSDEKNVSCAERRKYLRGRPAEIIKFTAGRSRSLFDYNRESGGFEFPFTWIVDFNFPEDPKQQHLDDMKELFVNAQAAGYSFVFVTSPAGFQVLKKLVHTYTDTPVLQVDCGRMLCALQARDTGGEDAYPLLEAVSPNETQIYNFMTAMKRFYDEGGAIDNRIDSVFASQGIQMLDASQKLTIPMALNSRGRLVNIEFGGEGSVHGFISGAANSGKSTLLHTIILSACLHYRPDDLEIWLIDYKQTEFHLYKKRTPPHIKLIGVSKTPDFTFSLLDKIEEEANRRTALMNRFDAQNLAEYRRHQGEPGYENITRLFLVIDEFHEMSQFIAAEMAYKDKLENILREYRAQGITCLLADQVFSTGLSGLTSAAKNQIGLRIAMRNEASPQEIKDTLEVDRALYSDSMQRTISIMSQGEFIMKVYVRNGRGELTDIRLEKFKGLFTKGTDIQPIGKALQALYKGQYRKEDLIYVNTKEQVPWSDHEPAALDRLEPLRYPNIRLYLGRSATLRPCFALDLGRQPDENVSIVGGTARQRWELMASVLRSCALRQYRLLVFMAEYSDLMSAHGPAIRALCREIPGAQLMETREEWCGKLKELDDFFMSRRGMEDTVCLFVGLETACVDLSRPLEERAPGGGSFLAMMQRYGGMEGDAPPEPEPEPFDPLPVIDRLFSSGARNGLRCVMEASVYRQFTKLLKIKDMCRHRIAFSMSADDCLMYLGNSNYQKSIGQYAVYSDGGKEIKKLLPYRLDT